MAPSAYHHVYSLSRINSLRTTDLGDYCIHIMREVRRDGTLNY